MNKVSDYYKNLSKKNPFFLKDRKTGKLHPVSKSVFSKALWIVEKRSNKG